MKKNQYRDLLHTSLDAATPELREDVQTAPIVTSAHVEESSSPVRRRRRPVYLRAAVAACLCLVLVVSVVAAVLLRAPDGTTPPPTPDYRSYITVDINPSFSLTIDDKGNVTHVLAENYDGEVVLDSITREGVNLNRPYDATLRALLSYAEALGYFATSDGINIQIYNKDASVKEEMQTHINAAVASVAEKLPPVSVGELARETILGIAGEIYAGITDAIGDDDLFRIIETKRGYGDRRHDKGNGSSADDDMDNVLYELTLAYYSIEALEELADCLSHLENYLTLYDMTAEEAFREGGQYIRLMKKRVDALLAWMGDDRTLTQDTYGSLRADAIVAVDEEMQDALEDRQEEYRRGEASASIAADLALVTAVLSADENVSAAYARLKAAYPVTDTTAFKQVTAMECSWRAATHLYGALDALFQPHGRQNADRENGFGTDGEKNKKNEKNNF